MSAGALATITEGGTVDRRTGIYIERPEDAELLELLADGRYCNVLTSRQMGKSSLMVSTATKLREGGVDCVIIDVASQLGSSELQADAYQGLLDSICDGLKLEIDVAAWWNAAPPGTPNQRFLRFLRQIGQNASRPIVIFLDEIDATLGIPYGDDIFTALRTMNNERSVHQGYRRLTFCILGVATPNELVKNQRTTAYNIGETMELRDFDSRRDDLSPLLSLLHSDRATASSILDRVLYWTGGQPYLTMKFCADLAEDQERDIDSYAARTYVSLQHLRAETHFESVLRFMGQRLSDSFATYDLYERILRGAKEPDRPALPQIHLKLSGLVKRNEVGDLVVRNPLYARLFDRKWLESARPRRTTRRVWIATIAASLTMVAVIVALFLDARTAARTVATAALQTLASDKDPSHAAQAFSAVNTEGPMLQSLFLRSYRPEVSKAYNKFLLDRADAAKKRGAIEQDLLFRARAAVVRDQPIPPDVLQTYNDLGFNRLRVTLRSERFLSGGMAVSPDGKSIAIGSGLWSAVNGTFLYSLADPVVSAVAYDREGTLYSGDDNGVIKRWRNRMEQHFNVDMTIPDAITAIAVSSDGNVIGTLSKDNDRVALLHRVEDGESIPLQHADAVRSIGLSLENAVTASNDRTACLWTLDGKRLRTLSLAAPVTAVAISGEGSLIVTASGATLTLWNRSGKVVATIRDNARIDGLAIASDGSEIATVSSSGLRRRRTPDLKEIDTIQGAGNPIAVAYAPDRSWILTRSVDAARIWSTSSAAPPPPTPEEVLEDWEQRFGERR